MKTEFDKEMLVYIAELHVVDGYGGNRGMSILSRLYEKYGKEDCQAWLCSHSKNENLFGKKPQNIKK